MLNWRALRRAGTAAKKKGAWPRLLALAAATEGVYLLMSRASAWPVTASWPRSYSPRLFEETLPFFALWAGLWIFYSLAVRSVRTGAGTGASLFILLTSAGFRATLLPAPGFEQESARKLSSEPASGPPLMRAATRLAPAPSATGPGRRWAPVDSIFDMKIMAVAADLAALALLPGMLRAAGLPSALALVFGWNPLAVQMSAGSAHLDSLGLFFLVLAVRASQWKAFPGAAAAYGTTLASGTLLAIPLPIMARVLGRRFLLSLAVGAAAWLYLYRSEAALVREIGWTPADGFGGSLSPAAIALAGVFLTRNPLYSAVTCLAAWLAFAGYRAFRREADLSRLPAEILPAMGGLVMVWPQVFPWTFVAIAYFSAFSPNPGWLVFAATAPLGYLALGGGSWSFWLGFAQYFPAYAVLIFGWLGGSRRWSGAG